MSKSHCYQHGKKKKKKKKNITIIIESVIRVENLTIIVNGQSL
jgi:hypothetical protein